MNSRQFPLPDAGRSQLRAIVATIDQEISRLSPTNGLTALWADLVEQLALGPEPEVRECPVCRHIGMRGATRCGYCWTLLSPFTEEQGLEG